MTTKEDLEKFIGLNINDIVLPSDVAVRDTNMIYTAQWLNMVCVNVTNDIIVSVGTC